MNPITVTLIANEGILIRLPECTLMIDGIHHDPLGVPDFSPVSQQLLRKIIHHEDIFEKIDYLLFSHNHGDHFSPFFTKKYLENNQPKGLIVPYTDSKDYGILIETAKQNHIPYYELNFPFFEKHNFQLTEHVHFSVFRTNHASTIFTDTENYCFLLNIHGKNFLFLADADYDVAYLKTLIHTTDIHTVFINPLFLNKSAGREVLLNAIKPENIVVYHIPFEEDDKLGFRYFTEKDVKRFESRMPPIKLLKYELQNLTLDI